MVRASKPVPEGIIQLQRQLEQFRSTHPLRTKQPEAIWLSAIELAPSATSILRSLLKNSRRHPVEADKTS
jgi:hypothetical protein